MYFAIRLAVVLLAINVGASPLQAEEWRTNTGQNPSGATYVSMATQNSEFAMEFYCDEHDWQDNRLGVKFYGPPLPALQAEDGDTARLSLMFTRRDGVLYREVWDAYYFDGGAGDQAWLGTINAGKSELDALAAALKLDILNIETELVYRFETVGTAAGVVEIRNICKLGLE